MFFKPKLTRVGNEKFTEYGFERVLKYFRDDGRDGDAPIIGRVAMVSLSVFDDRDHMTSSKLLGHKCVNQHALKQLGQSV